MADRLARARTLALEDAARPPAAPARDGRERRFVAVGDPQAPLDRFLRVLAVHDLLGDDGRLRPGVGLISAGDHFDWGRPLEREQAEQEAPALLSWLAAHPADQVIILAGNHDLNRVGELAAISDDGYRRARERADHAYWRGDRARPEGERRVLDAWFRRAYPAFPSSEVVARDFSTFHVGQRALVDALLRSGRMVMAHAHGGVLFVHAGVTDDEIAVLGVGHAAGAAPIAAALNAALLAAALARKERQPLVLDRLHVPGDASDEGVGMLYHRPSLGTRHGKPDAEERRQLDGPFPRRRFHPSRLPAGIVQVIGHIRDKKCRTLLTPWCKEGGAEVAQDGPVRTLVVDGKRGVYRFGAPRAVDLDAATMVFIDNGMSHVDDPARYQLLDADALASRT